MLENWKSQARKLKRETYALYLAYRDPRTPWVARLFSALVVAYAFSPIDLIPDPIPVLGYLDDLILIPLGIYLAVKMIPPEVLEECREQSESVMAQGKPVNRVAAAVIVAIWLLLAFAVALVAYRVFQR
ncbi:MAG: YkvA family protein [Anaerolineae bacterium]